MEAVLALRGVSKHFPTHCAVDNLSLEVERGKLYTLLGPSGCGKTTTLRLVAGFDQPTEGDIYLNGARINRLRPYERNISTVFQNYALFPHLSVQGNIEFGLRRKKHPDITRRVREMLDLVRLEGKESRFPAEISGGERQRVALARSLAVAPDVLLLDEPLSALDQKLRRQVRTELRSLQRSTGVTFLFVTHDQEEALSISDRVAVMHAGRLEQVGTPTDVYLKPATRFVATFVGTLNWINGAGLRPEAVRVGYSGPDEGRPCVRATVVESTFLGNRVHVEASLSTGERVVAELSRAEGPFSRGESVRLWWDPADELRFPAEAP